MILVTVGSTNFKFDRLFRIIDELCKENVLDGKDIIAQTGVIDYKIQNYENFDFASKERLEEIGDKADLVICHAGTGTVTGALKKGKKVIVFPRLQRFLEHESDNQLELAEHFYESGHLLFATNKEELIKALEDIKTFAVKPFISNKENFVKLIRELIVK